MRYTGTFFSFLLLCIFAVSCSPSYETSGRQYLTVASWNVQNLFDCIDDGTEYSEYTSSSGWSEEAYCRRLDDAASVLSSGVLKDTDILVLNEVENSHVVEDLLSRKALSDSGFCCYASKGAENGAIQTAVISRYEMTGVRIHSISEAEALRPVLEVEIQTPFGVVFVLAIHAKSNVGGVEETALQRIGLGKVLAEVAANMERQNPGALILIAGDFNDECWSEAMMGRQENTQSPLAVAGIPSHGKWYCFWMDENLSFWPSGSYFYDESWFCYDNILASAAAGDNTGWELYDAGVVSSHVLLDGSGKPNAWNRQLLKGVSDHLPVYIRFKAN